MTNYQKENTMNIPDTLPILSGGEHEAGAGQVCATEPTAEDWTRLKEYAR